VGLVLHPLEDLISEACVTHEEASDRRRNGFQPCEEGVDIVDVCWVSPPFRLDEVDLVPTCCEEIDLARLCSPCLLFHSEVLCLENLADEWLKSEATTVSVCPLLECFEFLGECR
jgi:hypothetical protein